MDLNIAVKEIRLLELLSEEMMLPGRNAQFSILVNRLLKANVTCEVLIGPFVVETVQLNPFAA